MRVWSRRASPKPGSPPPPMRWSTRRGSSAPSRPRARRFAMAAAVISRRASLAEYTDEFVRRLEVQELMRRIEIVTNENYDPVQVGASAFDQVTVELTNGGRVESEQVRRARGHAERPLGE